MDAENETNNRFIEETARLQAMQQMQNQLAKLKESTQPYNMPDAEADFAHWIKEGYWTMDEGIALLLGKNPEKVKWLDLEKHISHSLLAKKFDEIRKRANRYLQTGHLNDPVTPEIFIQWAEKIGIEIPSKLLEAANEFYGKHINWQSKYHETVQTLNEKEFLIKELNEKHNFLELAHAELLETAHPRLDPDNEDYSSELDIANIAHRAISNNRDEDKTFKEQAREWLDKNYSVLSNEAKERVAILINPDKSKMGGRKKE